MGSAQTQGLALVTVSLSQQEERFLRSALLAVRAALSLWTHCKNLGFKHQLLRRSLAARQAHRCQLLHAQGRIDSAELCSNTSAMTFWTPTTGSPTPIV